MRPDMAKVLDDRPRGGYHGSIAKGYRKDLQRTPTDEMRGREGIKARCRSGQRWSHSHLGPLRRFLGSNVGRAWDIVHSELCQGFAKGSASRVRLLARLDRFLERDVILIDGVPCRGRGYAHGSPLQNDGDKVFYVCPRSGLLRRAPRRDEPPG